MDAHSMKNYAIPPNPRVQPPRFAAQSRKVTTTRATVYSARLSSEATSSRRPLCLSARDCWEAACGTGAHNGAAFGRALVARSTLLLQDRDGGLPKP